MLYYLSHQGSHTLKLKCLCSAHRKITWPCPPVKDCDILKFLVQTVVPLACCLPRVAQKFTFGGEGVAGIAHTCGILAYWYGRRYSISHHLRKGCVCVKSLQSCQILCDLQTVAHQALLSMGFSRQEYWSGLPCLCPGDLPNPGIEPVSLMSLALTGGFFNTSVCKEVKLTYRHLGLAILEGICKK